jgi:hypothetical protein
VREPGPFGSTVDLDGDSGAGGATLEPDPSERGERPTIAEGAQVGRFRLLRPLGQGGMGIVYAAYDGQLDRVVALKMVRGDRSSAAVVGRFIREAKALARLSHPNVVQIFDVSALRGDVVLAMEYVRGRTLREEMTARRGLGEAAAIVDLFLQAGQGLAAVHAAGLVHRDFKPDNVMVGDDGRVRVMDFGLARAFDAPASAGSGQESGGRSGEAPLTAIGAVVGTPAYMAPEQHRGETSDARSDVFSFCAALWEALYGAPPYVPGDYARLQAPASDAVRVPGWLREVLLRGLDADPARRWPSLGPLLAALAADPVAARRRVRRWLGFAAGSAGLAVAATAGVLALQRSRAQARAEALAAEHLAAVEAHAAPEQAEAAFQVFVADPAHQGTRALAQAWRGQGDRRRAAGDSRGALAAYARAYADARAEADAQAAMRGIVEVYLGTDEAVGLGRAADALAPAPHDRDQTDLVVRAHLLRRDLERASAVLAAAPEARLAGAGPLLAALGRGRALGLTATQVEPLADPAYAAAVVDSSWQELIVLDRALAPALRWPHDASIHLVPGAPWASVTREGQARLFDVRAPERTLATVPSPSDLYPRRFVDDDGDGRGELYFLHAWPTRGFKVLGELAEPARVAHAGTEATGSDFEGLAVADLDGDGRREVAAAFGGHKAYDLRIFHADASRRGELELVARRTVGRARTIAPLRRPDGALVLAAAVDAGLEVEVFPEPPHLGAPPGLYLFAWTGEEIVERGYAPTPQGTAALFLRPLIAADLDGDGREELAVSLLTDQHTHTLIARQLDDGRLDAFVLGHTQVLAAAQLDDDPAHELFVADPADGALWVLGLGEARRPAIASPPREPLTPPPELRDESLRARLARADELDAIGLAGSAAEVVSEAAALVAYERARRRLLDHAARLFVTAGEAERALELGAQVEDDPELAAAALERRVELLTGLGRFGEAALAAERWRQAAPDARPAEAALARLRPLIDEDNAVEVGFAGPLDRAWRIERPAALRRDPAAGVLQVEAVARQPWLASLPLRWDGGPLQLEVELAVRYAEHNTALRLALFDEQDRPWLIAGVAGNGTDLREERHHSFLCQPDRREAMPLGARPAPTVATTHRMIVRAVYFPDRQAVECVVDDGDLGARKTFALSQAPAPGRYTLRLGGLDSDLDPHLIAVDVRAFSVRGARIDRSDPADGPIEAAARALVEGEPLAVLAALAEAPPEAPGRGLLALLAYDDLGDLGGIEASAGRALAALDEAGQIQLLRTRPGLAPRVCAAAGVDLPELLATAWRRLAAIHHDDPVVQRRVLAGLRGIEGLRPGDDDDRVALSQLLAARGRIYERIGALEQAGRDREAALTLLAGLPEGAAGPLRASIHEALAISLAAVDPDRALQQALQAVAGDPAPELLRERLGRRRAIVELAARDPAWRELVAPGRR